MFLINNFYNHLSWFFLFLSLFICSLIISLYITYINISLNLDLSLFYFWNTNLVVSFNLDSMSSWFCTTVLLISSIIFIYSYFYMSPYSNSNYFIWLTFLFVASMILVITITNVFFVILGWDGLGLISFLLIVYYQNSSSIFSGLNTVLINRIGDCLFVCSITCFFCFYPDLFSFSSHLLSLPTLFLLGLTFITNSAIFPFSPWLPLAMAAPTPISALVHSSTLVTSGLFLMIRFSYLFYSCYYFIVFLLILSVYTAFYAGLNTLFENDLKNLIALSTLSHLGFIGIAFSSGCLYFSFFHLLVHALFKSLLFITIGDIMINLSHAQDIRYLSSGYVYTPFSSSIMYVSLVNLAGLPNLSGFFSKDLVLETLNYSAVGSLVYFFVLFNLLFTFFYTFQLFYYSVQFNKLNPYNLLHTPSFIHSILLLILSVFTLFFGVFFLEYIFYLSIFVTVPFFVNMFPLFLLISFFLFFIVGINFPSLYSPFFNSLGSSMLFLSFVTSSISSQSFYNSSSFLSNSLENGFVHYAVNYSFYNLFWFGSKHLTSLLFFSPLYTLLMSFPLVFLLFL